MNALKQAYICLVYGTAIGLGLAFFILLFGGWGVLVALVAFIVWATRK